MFHVRSAVEGGHNIFSSTQYYEIKKKKKKKKIQCNAFRQSVHIATVSQRQNKDLEHSGKKSVQKSFISGQCELECHIRSILMR